MNIGGREKLLARTEKINPSISVLVLHGSQKSEGAAYEKS